VPFLYLSESTDRVLYAGKYTTANDEESVFVAKLTVCQSIVRRYIAVKAVNALRQKNKHTHQKIQDVCNCVSIYNHRTSTGSRD